MIKNKATKKVHKYETQKGEEKKRYNGEEEAT